MVRTVKKLDSKLRKKKTETSTAELKSQTGQKKSGNYDSEVQMYAQACSELRFAS